MAQRTVRDTIMFRNTRKQYPGQRLGTILVDGVEISCHPSVRFSPLENVPYEVVATVITKKNGDRVAVADPSPQTSKKLTLSEYRQRSLTIVDITLQPGRERGKPIGIDPQTGKIIIPDRNAWQKILGRDPREGDVAKVNLVDRYTFMIATPVAGTGLNGEVSTLALVAYKGGEDMTLFDLMRMVHVDGKTWTDFRDVLGLDENYTEAQVNKAFKQRSVEVHPDKTVAAQAVAGVGNFAAQFAAKRQDLATKAKTRALALLGNEKEIANLATEFDVEPAVIAKIIKGESLKAEVEEPESGSSTAEATQSSQAENVKTDKSKRRGGWRPKDDEPVSEESSSAQPATV